MILLLRRGTRLAEYLTVGNVIGVFLLSVPDVYFTRFLYPLNTIIKDVPSVSAFFKFLACKLLALEINLHASWHQYVLMMVVSLW
jgi:hypothetical protein